MSRPTNWPKGAWSHSQWTTLRTCTHAHKLRYRDKIYPLESSESRDIGTIFHRAREIIVRTALVGETPPDVWEEASGIARDEHDNKTAGLAATALLSGYRNRFGTSNAGFGVSRVIAAEEVLLGGDLHKNIGGLAAIADAVVKIEDTDGNWWNAIVEEKTTSRMPSGSDEDLIKRLKQDSQILTLSYCGWKTYGYIPGIIRRINVRTKTPGFRELFIRVSQIDLERWEQEQIASEALIPLDIPNRAACAPAAGFKCDYFNYCYGTDKDRAKGFKNVASNVPVDARVEE